MGERHLYEFTHSTFGRREKENGGGKTKEKIMAQKKLEPGSDYAKYDLDGDGVVTDEELAHVKEIKKTETELRKNLAQLRMARYTLIFMGCYAVFLASPWCSAEKLEGLGAVTDLIFLSGAGIVGAYMGTTAWMSKK